MSHARNSLTLLEPALYTSIARAFDAPSRERIRTAYLVVIVRFPELSMSTRPSLVRTTAFTFGS